MATVGSSHLSLVRRDSRSTEEGGDVNFVCTKTFTFACVFVHLPRTRLIFFDTMSCSILGQTVIVTEDVLEETLDGNGIRSIDVFTREMRLARTLRKIGDLHWI